MNLKTKAKYLFIYLFLNAIGILLAFRFWWTDPIILSGFNKITLTLLSSVGICWIGILFLSVMLSINLNLKHDNFKFISPFGLVSNEYFRSEIGIEKAKNIKNTITLIAIPVLFFTITTFIYLINIYENHQLKKYGIIENVTVKEIHYDVKHNPYAYFEFKNKKHTVNLNADSLKLNDKIKIIYSEENPNIVKYLDEYIRSK